MNETIPAINRLGAARRGAARRFYERMLDSAPELSRSSFQFQDILNPFSVDRKNAIANFRGERKIDRLSIPRNNFNFTFQIFETSIDIVAW